MADQPQPPVTTDTRWRSRPVLSATVRALAVATPATVALAVSLVTARLVPAPNGAAPRIVWWLALTAVSIAVMAAVHRFARRLLPLAALLQLSLVFPDGAPDRYKLARKVGRPKDLAAIVEQAREAGRDGGAVLGPQTVLELVAALSVHDRATRGHSERVRIFTDLIAAELKLPLEDRDRLRWAGLLHDVGKLGISPALLKKPSAPTAAEWALLKQHPAQGRRIIAPIADWLGPWALAVDHHHERYDGGGYPQGLHRHQISLGGRIVAVADAYETMTAARPYKRPMSPSAAREELVRCSGAHFDPVVVRAFLSISLGRLWRTIGISAWLSQVPLLPQVSSGLGIVGAQAIPMAARGAVGLALVAGASVAAPTPGAAAGGGTPPAAVSSSATIWPTSAAATPGNSGQAADGKSNADRPKADGPKADGPKADRPKSDGRKTEPSNPSEPPKTEPSPAPTPDAPAAAAPAPSPRPTPAPATTPVPAPATTAPTPVVKPTPAPGPPSPKAAPPPPHS